MKLRLLSAALVLTASSCLHAQHQEFYATMDSENAKELKSVFPNEVEILQTQNQQSAVFLTESAAHYLHKNVLTHGPGYVYKPTKNDALRSISLVRKSNKVLNFTITEDALVQQALSKVSADNIKNHMQVLENYGTRRHNTAAAIQSANDLKAKWQGMITSSGRTDVTVELVSHTGTPMPSVVLKINGNTFPTEHIIVGGHLDSISNAALAPGADDDASGIATITEMIRVLLDLNYKPQRTVEFMAYAAEEIGLVGSSEIATSYANSGKNVLSYVQFDMTNYKGSTKDIYLSTDSYNSNDLNLFLIELMTHYNASGTHSFTYGNTICNYGCSDHYSWAENGYDAAFPFEATFSQSNPRIHSAQDTMANMGNSATHSAKFAKLGLEFIIETSKNSNLAVNDAIKDNVSVYIENKTLKFRGGKESFEHISIIDTSGRKIVDKHNLLSIGQIDLQNVPSGFYLVVFQTKNGKVHTKKFILE